MFCAVFILAYIALLEDSPLQYPANRKPFEVFRVFHKRLTTTPLKELVSQFAGYADDLAKAGYLSGTDAVTGEFLSDMVETPVFKEYHVWFKTGNSVVMTYLLSFLKFGKKLEYHDADLQTTAFREWLDIEERLTAQELPSDLSDLYKIIRALLPPLQTDSWFPHHGPGRVAEKDVFGVYAKNRVLGMTPKLEHVLKSPAFKKLGEGIDTVPTMAHHHPMVAVTGDASYRDDLDTSVLRFVPKDIRKCRSICKEPASVMFYQQMLLDWFKRSLRDGPLRHYIRLEDQGVNRRAAVHGSTYGSVDTIDLSSASDSVGLDLVRKVFPREYLYYMLAVRTSRVRDPYGAVHDVKKFAPMGSAICFPTQCIIFAAVVVYSMMLYDRYRTGEPFECSIVRDPEDVCNFIQRHVHKSMDVNTPFTSKFEKFLVYGDDIICDSRVTDIVTRVLTSLRFSVNVSKSFTGSQALRESCGVYAFNGTDVTPYVFSVKYYAGKIGVGAYCSLIDHANNAHRYGYLNLRSYLIHQLRFTPLVGKNLTLDRKARKKRVVGGHDRWNALPFTEDVDGFGIYTQWAKNSHLFKRRNRRLQRREFYSVGPKTYGREDPPDNEVELHDHYYYVQDMRTRYFRNTVPSITHGTPKYRPEETGLRGGWMPL